MSDRIAVARISGAAERLSIGRDRGTPRAWAVAGLRAIVADPDDLGRLLGTVLGDVLWRIETERPDLTAAAELLRAAGADEHTAAARLAWQRERADRPGGWIRL